MRLFLRQTPREIALLSNGYVLVFKKNTNHQTRTKVKNPNFESTLVVESISESLLEKNNFVELNRLSSSGLLGIIHINGHIFIGVITCIRKVGSSRWRLQNNQPAYLESIFQILNVDFYCIDDNMFDGMFANMSEQDQDHLITEHPCGPLKKFFSQGSFYYSRDFDITSTIQKRGINNRHDRDLNPNDPRYIWNMNLISEMLLLRTRIPVEEKLLFDKGKFITFIIRGFCKTLFTMVNSSLTSLTLISKISTESKENMFSSTGVDKNGNLPLFVETELLVQNEKYIFAYVQIKGDIPLSWEVVENQLLHSRRVKLIPDIEFSQHTFDKHFDRLMSKYGVVSILNLTKPKNTLQETLSIAYNQCALKKNIKLVNLHYSSDLLKKSSHKLLYFVSQDIYEFGAFAYDISRRVYIGKQTGALRVSSFNSIEKCIQVEKCISREILDLTSKELEGFELGRELMNAHESLWSDNIFWLNRIYNKGSKNPTKYKKVYIVLFSPISKVTLYDPFHVYISKLLRKRRKEFSYEKTISIFAGTFNVNGKTYDGDMSEWLFPKNSKLQNMPDIYAIGFEEIVELTPGHILSIDPYLKQFWEKKILSQLNSLNNKKYTYLWGSQLGGVLLLLFICDKEYDKIKHIESDVKKTGFGGMSSNKGAVAINFSYSTTKFCILVSHLSAGLENIGQRRNDYKAISKNIRFSKGVNIKDHDAIIWMGDFNYRILLSNDEVRKSIVSKNYTKLFEKDQLNQQMIAGESFPYFDEMEIKFPPTYKFDPGTNLYDTSEKVRIPAWTDRILSRGKILKQLSYDSVESILFSDHMPVYATFEARTTVIDEAKRADISKEIQQKLVNNLSISNEHELLRFLRDANLPDETQNAFYTLSNPKRSRKLPPPSSDTKKWWIGNGRSIKVFLDVDVSRYMLNPERDVNPFIQNKDKPFFVFKKDLNTNP